MEKPKRNSTENAFCIGADMLMNTLNVPYSFITILGYEEAILLAVLYNKKKAGRWIKLPMTELAELIGMSGAKQRKIIKKLEAKNIVSVKYVGVPPCRKIRVNLKNLVTVVYPDDHPFTQVDSTPKSH